MNNAEQSIGFGVATLPVTIPCFLYDRQLGYNPTAYHTRSWERQNLTGETELASQQQQRRNEHVNYDHQAKCVNSKKNHCQLCEILIHGKSRLYCSRGNGLVRQINLSSSFTNSRSISMQLLNNLQALLACFLPKDTERAVAKWRTLHWLPK